MSNIKIKYRILIFFSLLPFFSCTNRETIVLKYEDYIIKGDSIRLNPSDTVFEGQVKYYDLTNHLISNINYTDDKKNGKEIDYYENGNIKQELEFYYDFENGLNKIYDSTGNLILEKNYYLGMEAGPYKVYSEDTFQTFRFTNFEGLDLYRCYLDSSKTVIENGRLLNYVTTYDLIDGNLKLSLFVYIINPPHKNLTYKLYDKNSNNQDSTLIFTASSGKTFFEKKYLAPPQSSHKYVWTVEAFYPSKNILLKNIIPEDERELKMPRGR